MKDLANPKSKFKIDPVSSKSGSIIFEKVIGTTSPTFTVTSWGYLLKNGAPVLGTSMSILTIKFA